MKTATVLVSAIVSTFNAERFMRGCIEDLETQSIADRIEIIVVDSASEQNESAIVRAFQQNYENIRYIRTDKRLTLYGAWNRALAIASGRYITSANTDDRHAPDAIERMAAVLDQQPDIALVYADVFKTGDENQTFGRCTPTGRIRWYDWNRNLLLQKGCFIGPQPMWRRSVHDVFGFFDESLVSSGDFEFWLRISQLFEFQHLRVPMGLYLESQGSIEHRNKEIKQKEDLIIQAAYLQAGLNLRLIQCQPLERLCSIHRNGRPLDVQQAEVCLDQLAAFIPEDMTDNRMVPAAEMENYHYLRKRVREHMVDEKTVRAFTAAVSRLLLCSRSWYPSFCETVRRTCAARPDRAQRLSTNPINS